jgi:hypothetical protein
MDKYRQKEIMHKMLYLVHQRFNKESLEEWLSNYFKQPITIELGCEDCDYLSDWNYMFTYTDENGHVADFDIYVLMHKNRDPFGNTFFITEVDAEFF